MDEGTDSYNLKVEAMAEVKEKILTLTGTLTHTSLWSSY